MQPLIYPSPEKVPAITLPSTTGGGGGNFDNWLPGAGPNGCPLYIRAFNIHVDGLQFDTAAATTIDGMDWWRFIKKVSVVQLDGVKRINELSGDLLRVMMEEKCGVEVLKEHGDIAASQTNVTTVKLTFRIQFYSDLLFEGDDLEFLADNFARIELQFADLGATELGVAGGTITLDSATWRIEAECVEHDYLLWASVDELIAVPFPGSSAELQTDINARLNGLTLFKRGASGGASLTDLTSVHIPGILHEALKRSPDLVELYAAHRGYSTGTAATNPEVARVSSPFLQDKACPVLWAHREEKVWTAPEIARITIKTVQASAISGLLALMRKGLPRNPAVHQALAMKYNGGKAIPWSLKTRDKTARTSGEWGKANMAYLPKKWKLPGKSLKHRGG